MTDVSEVSLTNGPLERFLMLAKGAGGRAVAMTIDQVLAAPDVHVFAELLELPSVQKLRGTPQESALTLLEQFAYGTYTDYKNMANSLPPLSPLQTKKLQMLTIVAMGDERKVLPYAELMAAIDMKTVRELEDLIIEATYRKLLSGKLDQKNAEFTVDSVIGRDLKPGDLQKLTESFVSWADNCKTIIADMDREMATADEAKASDAQVEADIVKKIEETKSLLKIASDNDGDSSQRKNGLEYSSSEFIDEHNRNTRGTKRL